MSVDAKAQGARCSACNDPRAYHAHSRTSLCILYFLFVSEIFRVSDCFFQLGTCHTSEFEASMDMDARASMQAEALVYGSVELEQQRGVQESPRLCDAATRRCSRPYRPT